MLIKLSNLNQLLSYHPYWRKLKDRERLIIFNVVSNLVVSKDTYIGMPKNNTVGWQSVHSIPTIPNLYQQNIESLGFSSYKMVDYELSEAIENIDIETRKIIYTICLNKIRNLRKDRYKIDYISQDKELTVDFPISSTINWSIDKFQTNSFDSQFKLNVFYSKALDESTFDSDFYSEVKWSIGTLYNGEYNSVFKPNVYYSIVNYFNEEYLDSIMSSEVKYEIKQLISEQGIYNTFYSFVKYEKSYPLAFEYLNSITPEVKYEIAQNIFDWETILAFNPKVNYSISKTNLFDFILNSKVNYSISKMPTFDIQFLSNVKFAKKKVTQAYDSTNLNEVVFSPTVKYTKLTI